MPALGRPPTDLRTCGRGIAALMREDVPSLRHEVAPNEDTDSSHSRASLYLVKLCLSQKCISVTRVFEWNWCGKTIAKTL